MDPYRINVAVTAAADAIARQLDDDNLVLWSTVFTQLGSSLSSIAAIRTLKSEDDDSKPSDALPAITARG